MLSDLRKSFGAIFYERTSSPLYGAFIISWLVWNWKIPYVTFFVDGKFLEQSRIDWIIENNADWKPLVLYPFASAWLLILLGPLLSNWAYFISIKYRKWRVDKRNEVEKKALLTLDQSIALREEVSNQDERFQRILENKNNEISQLTVKIEQLEKRLENTDSGAIEIDGGMFGKEEEAAKLADRIHSEPQLERTFDAAISSIQGGYSVVDHSDVSSSGLAYLEANDVVESLGDGRYHITEFGRQVLKQYHS